MSVANPPAATSALPAEVGWLARVTAFGRAMILPAVWLGLAPWPLGGPEPHVVEKVRWVLQGGAGMRAIDVFDLLMHGSAAALAVVTVAGILVERTGRAAGGAGR